MSTLGMAVCVWVDSYTVKDGMRIQIVFYSVSSEDNCSFLIVEAEFCVTRIRISDRVDRMITEHYGTGEVKVFDMAEVFTYSHFKEKLTSTLQADECTKLTNFFKIPKDQTDAILSSDKASENLMLALEEKARSHYKEDIKKLNEEIKTLRMTSEEEGKDLKTSWTIHKAPDGRIYYHNSVTKEIRWENPESGQRAELQNTCKELYLNLCSKSSEFIQESSFEGGIKSQTVGYRSILTKYWQQVRRELLLNREFAKFSVSVRKTL
ncbi:hypothetical protein HOLleu_21647 [Holothuria leucospilota]|uniref:WW domain-containing protein n=1 Tax=Holothuria leucospilota TaxID=206669 RepID=A0A9Q1BXK2_HOLLE|nr:hypothetical protein HOLleu_21647 [Holothuria leucospilota]